MKAYEMSIITQDALAKKNSERPGQLFAELLSKMKCQAEEGLSYITFYFMDTPEIVGQVLDMLKKEGYIISKEQRGVIKISWKL